MAAVRGNAFARPAHRRRRDDASVRMAWARSRRCAGRRIRARLGHRTGLRCGRQRACVRCRCGSRAERIHDSARACAGASRLFRWRRHDRHHRRNDRGIVGPVRILPRLERARRSGARRERPLRAATHSGAALHRGHLGHGLPRRWNPLRHRDQYRHSRHDRRRRLDAAGPRARAGRTAWRRALRGSAQGDVGAADRHAALRARALARGAVRAHRAHHQLAGERARHSALALDLRSARCGDRAASHLRAGRVHGAARRSPR